MRLVARVIIVDTQDTHHPLRWRSNWPVVVLRFVEVAAVVVATPVVSVPPMMAVSMTTPSSLAVVPMVTARATIGVHVRAPVTEDFIICDVGIPLSVCPRVLGSLEV